MTIEIDNADEEITGKKPCDKSQSAIKKDTAKKSETHQKRGGKLEKFGFSHRKLTKLEKQREMNERQAEAREAERKKRIEMKNFAQNESTNDSQTEVGEKELAPE